MMGRTHALLGALAAGTFMSFVSLDTLPLGLVLGAFGALLPDLDASESKIKRLSLGGVTPFVPLAVALSKRYGHRGALHSLWGWGAATLLFLPLAAWNPLVPLALSTGYLSHILGDSCTKSGVPMLYPRLRRYHLLPRPLRLTTGSLAEEGVLVVAALLLLVVLLKAVPHLA